MTLELARLTVVGTTTSLAAVFEERRRQLRFRLGVTAMVTILSVRSLHGPAVVWGVGYAALQLAEAKLFDARRGRPRAATSAARLVMLAVLFINSATFGSLAILTILRLGAWGFGVSSYFISGAILAHVLSSKFRRDAFYASISPYLIYLLLSSGLIWRQGASAGVIFETACGGGLLVVAALRLRDHSAHAQAQQLRTACALEAAVDRAEAASRAKSDFLATMSHEIRTPLNGVLGMAQVMALHEMSPAQRARLDVVTRSGEAVLDILNDVLDLSKIEAGALELEAIRFDLGDLVRSAHAAFQVMANQKALSLHVVVQAQAEGVYLGDPTRLRQVLLNLASNAVKFTSEGAIEVRVTREAQGLHFEVADTGVGMTPAQLLSLFKNFAQADVSTTRRFGGTGLGLAISSRLVARMGGVLTAESAPGVGSTFTFDAPLVRVADPPLHEAGDRPVTTTSASELRVLAAEDNAVNRLVLKALLNHAGVEPTMVENGRLALEAWAETEWDVILMDVHMPEIDGLEATRRIRAEEARSGRARTRIVALTANALQHQVVELMLAGMDDHVAKPIEVGKLFAALDRAPLSNGAREAVLAA